MLSKTKLADEVVAFGRNNGYGFRVVEGWGVMEEETYQDGWWYLSPDSSQIQKVSKRIDLMKSNGFEIQQIIIAHEAPRLLCAPQTAPSVKKDAQVKKGKLALWIAGGILAGVGVLAMTIFMAYMMLLLFIPLMIGGAFVLMLGLGVLVDPVAICILSDGSRVAVMSWVE